MSQLQNALRQIAKKSSHPNVLLYQFQLVNAKQKHLVKQTEHETVLLAQPGPSALNDASGKAPKVPTTSGDICGLLATDLPAESSRSTEVAPCENASPKTAQEPTIVERASGGVTAEDRWVEERNDCAAGDGSSEDFRA
jgi:hypothetical protein